MTTIQRSPTGITFAVDDVIPATGPLALCRAHEAVQALLGCEGESNRVESCFNYHDEVLDHIRIHPLLAAVHTAFAQHRPLVLTPDAVWLTIAQGVAHHMAIHGEQLRDRFIAHQGKLRLVVKVDDFVKGSPENDWPMAFATWNEQIRTHVGEKLYGTLISDFSTTDRHALAASQIIMMDVFERYFHYEMLCICGIPTMTLEGSVEDWTRLREKAGRLEIFDMPWWLKHLLPICDQFIRAAQGDIDLAHWQAICKRREEYGGDIINGWIAKLFPYIREFTNGPTRRRNPIFETGEGFSTLVAACGLSRVPFTWTIKASGGAYREYSMEALGGMIGIAQDPQSLALCPRAGWAVREVSKLDAALARLERDGHDLHRGNDTLYPRSEKGYLQSNDLPADLAAFYHRSDGADLFPSSDGASFRILPLARVERLPVERSIIERFFKHKPGMFFRRIVELRDGGSFAIASAYDLDVETWATSYLVCYCPPARTSIHPKDIVVANSFTDLLAAMLNSKGEAFWLVPGFHSMGTIDSVRATRG
ncbi:MAG TPA: DUF4419 domain-containing protein [Tepidisphaeraceae bacterium]|jgi:hypothetical protein|nr:DUF4419 domain-containing protein [Tepidisphaeraceae bacterium]